MSRAALVVAGSLLAAACASADPSLRGGGLRGLVDSTVLLRADRGDGSRRAGSGVVVAADPAAKRAWIVTTRHLFDPPPTQRLVVQSARDGRRVPATVRAVGDDIDLALIEVNGLALPPAVLADDGRLGDEVRVIAFPFGRRLTVVSGIVSQIATEGSGVEVQGPVRMVDASVSFGTSGGGVFDAATGALLGIVESYGTARVTVQDTPERSVDIPVPGQTTVLSAARIRRFLETLGVAPAR